VYTQPNTFTNTADGDGSYLYRPYSLCRTSQQCNSGNILREL